MRVTIYPTAIQVAILEEVIKDNPTSRRIGARLGTTEHTIKTHLSRISRRTGIRGRPLLALAFYKWRYLGHEVKGWTNYNDLP